MVAYYWLLAGGGPSDADVANAVKEPQLKFLKQVESELQRPGADQKGIFGSAADVMKAEDKLINTKIEVGEKTKQNDGTYVAVVTVEGRTDTVKLAKASDGWHVIQGSNR